MKEWIYNFWNDDTGAVAPTVALALFGLIAAGGIAFDYARMASLDTELQQAADQSALAAASQLDEQTGSRTRATSAAQNLVTNLTFFANDNGGTTITIPTVEFYSTHDAGRANLEDPPGISATSDANARFVRVTVATRQANYALTPVVALLNSGNMSSRALAGIGSAICNTPPVMICNPQEPPTNTNPTFPFSVPPGDGLLLVSVGNGGGGWVPGNFGYLNNPGTGNGASGLRESLGWDNVPGECSPSSGVDTKPGASVDVTDSLNTRFDIADNTACPAGGTCSSAGNIRTDLVRESPPGGANNRCRIHNQGWHQPVTRYNPTSATVPLTVAQMPQTMGHPRDMCHSVNPHTCAQVGNGTWDRNAYFRVNFGAGFDWQAAMTTAGYTPSTVTRYQVYQWELADTAARLSPTGASGDTRHGVPICGSTSTLAPERRRISAAVVNCRAEGVSGSSTGVRVLQWADLFLVEPSYARGEPGTDTHAGDVYVEYIGDTLSGGAGTPAGQVIRRDVPRLLE